ncbi:MAG: hypothetical protein QOH49_1237 [Acidobacteriota bacterium]|nr:hypothetical protein [Acidobacteriota bacterium]
MLKAIRVSTLILLLACSAQAGYMQNGLPEPPPPPQPASAAREPMNATQEPTTNGIMQNDAPSGLTQIALDVLAALPSLF